jgi:hypothetical protein
MRPAEGSYEESMLRVFLFLVPEPERVWGIRTAADFGLDAVDGSSTGAGKRAPFAETKGWN